MKCVEIVIKKWDCGRHLHQSEGAAIRCAAVYAAMRSKSIDFEKRSRASLQKMGTRRRRYFLAASMRYDGLKLKEIGDQLGVGRERARSLSDVGQCELDRYFRDLNFVAQALARGAQIGEKA